MESSNRPRLAVVAGLPTFICVCLTCNGFIPSGGSGALFLTHSSTTLNDTVCGVNLCLTFDWLSLHDHNLVLSDCPHNKIPLALRFSEKVSVCDTSPLNSEIRQETETETSLSESRDAVWSKTKEHTQPPHRPSHHSPPSSRKKRLEPNAKQTLLLFILILSPPTSLFPLSASPSLVLFLISTISVALPSVSSINELLKHVPRAWPCPILSFFFASLQHFTSFGPRRHRAFLKHFLHHTKDSPFGPTLLTMSCPPKCVSLHLPNLWPQWASHFPGIFIFSLFLPRLMQRYLLAAAHHSARCLSASTCLSTRVRCSFVLGLSSSQSCHSSTRQCKPAEHNYAA